MKKLLLAAGVAGLLVGGAGTAVATSDNANGNACFGQERSKVAQTGDVGTYARDRMGENATINHEYMTGEYEGSPCEHSGNPGGKKP